MDVIRLVRILVGKPRDLGGDGAPTWRSGICKEPAMARFGWEKPICPATGRRI